MEFVDALSLKPRRVRKTYVTVSGDVQLYVDLRQTAKILCEQRSITIHRS